MYHLINTNVIETVRMVLRKFGESDRDAIFGFLGDREVMRFSLNGPSTREDVQTKYLPSCQKRYARDGLGQWAVIRKSDGLCIGECGICVQEVEGKREDEISYRLRRDCWGQGFATEATRACRDYGFNSIGLHRLISIIEAENTASIRVAEKMGMILEKKALFHRVAVQIYSVTRQP
jgi:RimJ/RimL family protein N-acetyltransferase